MNWSINWSSILVSKGTYLSLPIKTKAFFSSDIILKDHNEAKTQEEIQETRATLVGTKKTKILNLKKKNR